MHSLLEEQLVGLPLLQLTWTHPGVGEGAWAEWNRTNAAGGGPQVAGMRYLHGVLGPVIDRVFEEKKYVELDPSKVEVKDVG